VPIDCVGGADRVDEAEDRFFLTLQIPDARGDRAVGKKTWTVMFSARLAFTSVALYFLAIVATSIGIATAQFV
jgi:hypothetical protein